MMQYGYDHDMELINESPKKTKNMGKNRHIKQKKALALPPKLSETGGPAYHKKDSSFLVDVCPHMVVPLIAAADVKEKNRLVKLVMSEKVDCKKGKLFIYIWVCMYIHIFIYI
jgi:hypothetical protein